MAYYGDDNAFEDRERLKEERSQRGPRPHKSSEEITRETQISSLLLDKKRLENELINTAYLKRRDQLRAALQYVNDKLLMLAQQ